MRPKWIVLAVALAVLWFLADAVLSSMALSDFSARPLTLVREDGRRVPVVQGPGDGTSARLLGAEGMAFGYRLTIALPGGGTVTCGHIGRWMWCGDGWHAERG